MLGEGQILMVLLVSTTLFLMEPFPSLVDQLLLGMDHHGLEEVQISIEKSLLMVIIVQV